MKSFYFVFVTLTSFALGCNTQKQSSAEIQPAIVTQKVRFDSDDPAIWINPSDLSKSLILGTDKGGETGEGALYVFRLDGSVDSARTVWNLQRPNNVDVAYGFSFRGGKIDIAVCTERNTNTIRVFALPDMKPIDGGGIPVFEKGDERAPMGIALFTDLPTNNIYAFVSRKSGPEIGYLHQYKLIEDSTGVVKGDWIRAIGRFEGGKEIEAIAVDNELGYLYYSDEGSGVRKYYAHPDSSDQELAFFGKEDIKEDHEGISIYKADDGTGYILLSDQQSNEFHIFPREGEAGNPHSHPLLKVVKMATRESDGSDVSNVSLNETFTNGLFVAMSTDGTFQLYKWEDIAGEELFKAPNGKKKILK
jgi:3-phytase